MAEEGLDLEDGRRKGEGIQMTSTCACMDGGRRVTRDKSQAEEERRVRSVAGEG